ncbi:MAG: SRPBCC family protein [Nocardioides sp.]
MPRDPWPAGSRQLEVVVAFPQPPDVAFDYLKDPRNRPDWQSSLSAVADVVGDGEVGTTWTDVTKPGLRPRLRVTACEPALLWVEEGEWRAIRARLSCHFRQTADGTLVRAVSEFDLPGALRLAAPGLRLITPAAMRADLRRAARLVG